MMRAACLLLSGALLASQPAFASDLAPAVPSRSSGSAAKPDEATVAEAIKLLDTDQFDEQTIRSADLTIGVMLASMIDGLQKRTGGQVPQDLVLQLRTTIHDFTISKMRANLPAMKRRAAEIYAEQFTKAELARLRELHSNPVAVKARERSAQMQPKLMEIGVNTMRAEQPELEAKLKQMLSDYMKAHGVSSPADPS